MAVVDGDLLDEFPDEAFVELGDALLCFLAAAGVGFCLRFLFAQPEDFVGDGVVILLAVGLADEPLLQLVEPRLDSVRAHRVGGRYRFCDVLMHLPDEAVPVVEHPVECLDHDILQEFFFHRSAGAVHGGAAGFKAADAPPDDVLAAVVVPVDAPVELAAFPADDRL